MTDDHWKGTFYGEYRDLFLTGMTPEQFLDYAFKDLDEKGNWNDRMPAVGAVLVNHCTDGEAALKAILQHTDHDWGMEYLMGYIPDLKNISREKRQNAIEVFFKSSNSELGHAAVDALNNLRKQKEDILRL